MLNPDAVVIGDGISGLILALGLSRKGMDICVVSRPGSAGDNSPFILPIPAQRLLELVCPGSTEELIERGARLLTHADLIQMKFPNHSRKPKSDKSFILLSRNLLLNFLQEKVSLAKISTQETEVQGLILSERRIRGIRTQAGDLFCANVFDCTGSPGPRKLWFGASGITTDSHITRGPREKLYLRFFETTSERQMILRSEENFRGGIYPLEKNLFSFSVTIPESTAPMEDQIDEWADSIFRQLGATRLLENSSPSGDWQILNIANTASTFYRSEKSDEAQGFYPLGDGLIFSNPIFGRGLSLFSYQITPLLQHLNDSKNLNHHFIIGHLRHGEESALQKWKEVTSGGPIWMQNLFRKLYLPLLDRNAEAYEVFLEFYQMNLTPSELLVRLARSALSTSALK